MINFRTIFRIYETRRKLGVATTHIWTGKTISKYRRDLLSGQRKNKPCSDCNADGTVHESNKRAKLRELADKFKDEECWFGIEQEYTFFDGIKPLGWPDNGFQAPKGGYYLDMDNEFNDEDEWDS